MLPTNAICKALITADTFGADAILVLVTPQFMTDMDEIAEIFYTNSFRTKVFPVLLGGQKTEAACRTVAVSGSDCISKSCRRRYLFFDGNKDHEGC